MKYGESTGKGPSGAIQGSVNGHKIAIIAKNNQKMSYFVDGLSQMYLRRKTLYQDTVIWFEKTKS